MLHTVKADSQKLHLMHAAVEDISISAEIGIFLFFHTTHFCCGCTHQMQLV